jgi:hypothetical protein
VELYFHSAIRLLRMVPFAFVSLVPVKCLLCCQCLDNMASNGRRRLWPKRGNMPAFS